MKNSKSFSNVAKKSLAVALTGLSLAGSMQNVSAMKPIGQVQNHILDEAHKKYWDEFSEKSNKNFITRKDEKDKSAVKLTKKRTVNI